MTRLYGRKGFTQKKDVKTLLAPHEETARRGVIPIRRLNHKAAVQLAELLPIEQMDDRVTDAAPTFFELLDFVQDIEGSSLLGFRVPPDQEEERISLQGFVIPQAKVDVLLMERVVNRAADARIVWIRDGREAALKVTW